MQITALIFVVALLAVSTQTLAAPKPQTKPGDFAKHVYTGADGAKLPYRLLTTPAPKSKNAKRPLLIFLHGAGERGQDNEKQLIHGRPFMEKAARKHQVVVLAPQCPREKKWVEVPWNAKSHTMPAEPSQSMRLLLALLPNLREKYNIDPQRIYVMGLSMGGYGTWDIVQRHPRTFAAAVPICGGGDVKQAARIKHVSIWAFHGARDRAVPVARSRDMIAAIRAAGGDPKYSEYPDVGHNVWTNAFNDAQMFDWLFKQKRGAKK